MSTQHLAATQAGNERRPAKAKFSASTPEADEADFDIATVHVAKPLSEEPEAKLTDSTTATPLLR